MEKVSYQVGVNIIGINEYVEHDIPEVEITGENIESEDIDVEYSKNIEE